MKIAFDITPITNGASFHNVRGVGSYIRLLRDNLSKYDSTNKYVFVKKGDPIASDIDFIHYPYFDPFFLSLQLTTLSRSIITIHDLTPIIFKKNFPVGVKGNLVWNLQKMLLSKIKGVITDSECSKSDVERITKLPAKKVDAVLLAADQSFRIIKKEDRESTRKKYDLPSSFVLYVGDVTWNKNLPRLVRAIKKTDLTLIMVGKALAQKRFDSSNPWNNDLVYIQKEISENKQFKVLGFLELEDLVSLYNIATAFVMPSLYEGFGLGVLEAMCCGCPVVTSNRGSLPEVGGDAVYYVNPESSEEIAKGLNEVMSNTNLREKLSKAGIVQAKKFSIEKVIKDTIKVYEKYS